MRFFVVAHDGNQYGPADMVLLQQWAWEGRVTPQTMLAPESGGAPIRAGGVAGLAFPPVAGAAIMPTSHIPPAYAPYPTAGYPTPFDYNAGIAELRTAWGFAALAGVLQFLCGFGLIPGLAALFMASRAKSKGQRDANLVMGVSLIIVVYSALMWILSR